MNRKLLVICGQTATGKTKLALELAEKFNGELISADSMQVYCGTDIVSGKDLQPGFKYQKSNLKIASKNLNLGYYRVNCTKIWGYDLISPKNEFSVSDYIKCADLIIKDIEIRGKLPIIVGGAGLYIKGVVDGIGTADIKRNLRLRKSLGENSVDDLFGLLSNIDPQRARGLNSSDRKNPRRIVRAIEISLSKNNKLQQKPGTDKHKTLFIGLQLNRNLLEKRIEDRVYKRMKQGVIEEAKKLLKLGVKWDSRVMLASGYRQLRDYLEGIDSIDQFIKKWTISEIQYAKRQLTWFKKDKRINWFDVSKKDYYSKVEKLVESW